MRVPMQVTGLTVDPVNNAPIVVLRELEPPHRVLPIWIGVVEASAIAFELEKIKLTRPMTHDLIKVAVEALGGHVERVEIADLREGTYYARVVLTQGQGDASRLLDLDARPSDAIAVALRTQAPILCEDAVLQQASERRVVGGEDPEELREAQPGQPGEGAQGVEPGAAAGDGDAADSGPRPLLANDPAALQDVLERLRPEDFGKYKM